MNNQIQQLIADGKTEEALRILAQQSDEAIGLQSRYSIGKRQYLSQLITSTEWSQMQAQITYAALELSRSLENPASNPTPSFPDKKNLSPQKRVFVSYNHGDQEVAVKARTFLENNHFEVILDADDMPAGMSIMQFIQESIKKCDAVLSIVSAKSLKSGWVGQESVASMYAVWLADKQFIPVKLDDVAFDIDFQIEAQENLLAKIGDLQKKISKLRKLGGDSRAFDDDLNRMNDLKNNLGQIIQRFKSVLMLDISEKNFEANMGKVLKSLER